MIDALASAAILEGDLKAVSFFRFLEANILSRNIANKANADAFSSELEKLRSLKEE